MIFVENMWFLVIFTKAFPPTDGWMDRVNGEEEIALKLVMDGRRRGSDGDQVTRPPSLGGPRQAPRISFERTPKRGSCWRPQKGPLKHPLISVITLGWMNVWTPPLIKMWECIQKLPNFCVYMSTFVVIIDQRLVYLAIPSTHVWSKDSIHLLFDILILICKCLSRLPMTNLPFMQLLGLFHPFVL